MRGVYTILLILFLTVSCSQKCRDLAGLPSGMVEIKIRRLEAALFEAPSEKEVLRVLTDNQDFARLFLHSDQYPNDSILAKRLFRLTKEKSMDTLYRESKVAFADLEWLKADLGEAIFKIQAVIPEVQTPELKTAVTGFYNDLFISDSLVIIGLDYFLGSGATYRPLDIPAYILNRYSREYIVSTITKFLIGPYIEKGPTETMLSEMIDFGKTFYVQSRILPCTPDSILLGYTTKDMKLITENEAVIWANFVENEILYETNHFTKRKFLGERPNVYEINADCPGRIGTWIGWRIVEAYMKNNNVSLQELMKERDHDKIFRLSGYKPKG